MTEPRVCELPGGARLMTDYMPGVESATLGVWFGAGSRNETAEINGVAHLLEHMVFKGTRSRSAFDIVDQIESVGGHIDAYTTSEQTAYSTRVLSEHVALSVEILGDILCNSRLDEEDLVRERAVILQEIGEADDAPDDVVFDLFTETALPDQPLGRPILGRTQTIGAMPREDVIRFRDSQYSTGRMVFAAAGNVDHDRLATQVTAAFESLDGRIPAPAEPARYVGGDARRHRDLQQVHLMIGVEALPFRDPDLPALQILSRILGGGMSSRLFQEIRENRGLAYSIGSISVAYQDVGLFGIHAATGPDQVGELVPAVCDELVRIANDDADATLETEILRVRTQVRANMLMARESSASRCEALARNMHAFGRNIGVQETIERFDRVDAEAVRTVCRRLLSSPPTLAAVGPVGNLETWETLAGRLR